MGRSLNATVPFADLIEASPAAGFVSKPDFGDAIRALLSDNGSIGSSTPTQDL